MERVRLNPKEMGLIQSGIMQCMCNLQNFNFDRIEKNEIELLF